MIQPTANGSPNTVPNTSELIDKASGIIPSYLAEPKHDNNLMPFATIDATPIDNHARYIDLEFFKPGMDLDEARAFNQSGAEQLLHGAGKFLLRTAGTVINSIVAPIDALASIPLHGNIYQGPIGTFIDKIYEKGEEWMPNYYTADEKAHTRVFTGNFIGDKLLKNAGFTVGTIAGMMLTMGGTGKLISNGMKLFTKNSKKLSDVASKVAMLQSAGFESDAALLLQELGQTGKLTTKSLAHLNKLTNPLIANKFNQAYHLVNASLFESASETREGVKRITEEFEKRGYDINDPEIQEKIDQAGREIFTTNMAILTLSNAVMYGSLFKANSLRHSGSNRYLSMFKGTMEADSKAAFESTGMKNGLGLSNIVKKEAYKKGGLNGGLKLPTLFNKVGMKSKNALIAGKITKGAGLIGWNVLSEGLYEEGGQFATQKAAEQKAFSEYDDSETFDDYTDNLKRVWKNIGIYNEGKESVLLGSLTGGMASMIKGGVETFGKKGKQRSAIRKANAQTYVDTLHGMWKGDPEATGGFLEFYKDKVENGKVLHNQMKLQADSLEKLYRSYHLASMKGDETAKQNVIDKIQQARITQFKSIDALMQNFEAVGEIDMFYNSLDILAQMDNAEFSKLIGLADNDKVDDIGKRDIINDLKEKAKVIHGINDDINRVREIANPDSIYRYTADGNLISTHLTNLKDALLHIAAYNEEYEVLKNDFNSVWETAPDGERITLHEVEERAIKDGITNLAALEVVTEEHKKLMQKAQADKGLGDVLTDNSKIINNALRRKDSLTLLSTLKNRESAINLILLAKTELEAALLTNKGKAKQNAKLKDASVNEYLDHHLAKAGTMEEVAAIDDYLSKENIDPSVYEAKIDARMEEVERLTSLKDQYEAKLKDSSNEAKSERIELKRRIDQAEQMLGKKDNQTNFNLQYLTDIFQPTKRLRKKGEENLTQRQVDKKRKAEAKEQQAKEKEAIKKGEDPTKTEPAETTTTTPEEEEYPIEPIPTMPSKAEGALGKMITGIINSPNQMKVNNVIEYKDDETNEICDPQTGKIIKGGNRKAKNGLTTNFTPGGKWGVITQFKGASHAHGGIDISIGNGKVSMTGKNANIKAANGMLLTARDYTKIDDPPTTDDPPTVSNIAGETDNNLTVDDVSMPPIKPSYENIPRYNSRIKGAIYYNGKDGTPEQHIEYMNSLIDKGAFIPPTDGSKGTLHDFDMDKLPDVNFKNYDEYDMLKQWYSSDGAKQRYINSGGSNHGWNNVKKSMLAKLDKVALRVPEYNITNYIDDDVEGLASKYKNGRSNIMDLSGGWNVAHEATHGMTPEQYRIINNKAISLLKEESSNIDLNKFTKEFNDYLLTPVEIFANINQMRFDMRLDPDTPLTSERLEQYIKNVNTKGSPMSPTRALLDIMPVKTLLRFFNEIVDNSPNDNNDSNLT